MRVAQIKVLVATCIVIPLLKKDHMEAALFLNLVLCFKIRAKQHKKNLVKVRKKQGKEEIS